MKTSNLRNIVLLGHSGVGKTSLAEAMLFNAKAIDRLGRVNDGNTSLDYDPEEIKRQVSISLGLAAYSWKNRDINIIDTPGYFDFVGDALGGVYASESALIVLGGGIAVGTEKAFDLCEKNNIPRAFYFNKMNDETADFDKDYHEVQSLFGNKCLAFQLPIRVNRELIGYVDTILLKAFEYQANGPSKEIDIPGDLNDLAQEIHMQMSEFVAETDDELMEKFFNGETFTEEEFIKGVKVAINNMSLFPVLIGSAYENMGAIELNDFVVNYLPAPGEIHGYFATDKDDNEIEIKPNPDGEPVLFIFKTIADPFVGRMSLFKVCQGTIKSDSSLYNSKKGRDEKISNMFLLRGKKQIPVSELFAGSIGVVTKLSNATTNDTLSSKNNPVKVNEIKFPTPEITFALSPKAKGDEDKIGQSLSRLADEDLTFTYAPDAESGQMLVSGMGEQHIDIIVSKMQSRYQVGVVLSDPKIPYRETIKKKVKVQGRHKKQSGGHGQFGDVWIEFEPGENEDLEFGEKIFGGAVPKNYFPAVEKGLLEAIQKGVLAGYPVLHLKATLVDGSYHAVDSSEMAFKIAASLAYKKGLAEASPVLLEPIYQISVYVPERYMGDIIGDLNKRRGRVLGMNPIEGGLQEIVAEVPYTEIMKYSTDLRSMTQARGEFKSKFVRYEEVPNSIAEKVIAAAKSDDADDN